MQPDTAVLKGLLQRQCPFNRLHGSANVLIFPTDDIVNMAVIAAVDAEERGRRAEPVST